MDTSKTYIDMCNRAVEIQAKRIPLWGFCTFRGMDCFVYVDTTNHKDSLDLYKSNNLKVYYYSQLNAVEQPRVEKTIWLPNQDNLWELLIANIAFKSSHKPRHLADGENLKIRMFNTFVEWYKKGHYEVIDENDLTLEKLILQFVMLQLYNKVWNSLNLEWQKINYNNKPVFEGAATEHAKSLLNKQG